MYKRQLISPAAEFTAGMQNRKNNLNRRNAGFVVNSYRNTAAIVYNRDRIILVYRYFYGIAITGQRFIYRIIYNLIHQMVQTSGGGTATKPFNMEVLKLRINKIIEMNVKRQEIFNQDIKIEPRD